MPTPTRCCLTSRFLNTMLTSGHAIRAGRGLPSRCDHYCDHYRNAVFAPPKPRRAFASAGLQQADNVTTALHNPARLSGQLQSAVTVPDRGGDVSLDAYMRLPPEQYDELDPKMIQSLGGNRFRLNVPRVALFNVWVQPTVDCSVRLVEPPPQVVLEAERCELDGSDLLRRMQLNDRFTLHFTTALTWTPGSAAGKAPAVANGSEPAALDREGSIQGDLQLTVLTEVIPPFDLIPRSALEGTCNAVLRTLMRTLLPLFLRNLAKDYERWATSPEYRARRAGRAPAK